MDAERPRATPPRASNVWAWAAVAALIAFAAGLGVGALVSSDGSPERSAGRRAQGVPPVCLQAIEAARHELGLRSEATQLPEAYASVVQRAVDALRRGDTKTLEELTADLQALNQQAQDAVQGMLNDSFSQPARACESLPRESLPRESVSPGAATTASPTASG